MRIRFDFSDGSGQAQPRLYERPEAVYTAHRTGELASVLKRVEAALDAHRAALLKTLSAPSIFTRLLAPIVTIGAALWFPIVQPVLDYWAANPQKDLPNYAAGTWGPAAAEAMLEREGRHWHNP